MLLETGLPLTKKSCHLRELFVDAGSDTKPFTEVPPSSMFLCRSAVSTKETIEVNGETYPVYKMEISNTSHPFYTGKIKLVDTAGRVDKFMSRYAKRYDKKNK